MPTQTAGTSQGVVAHGAGQLAAVHVDAYNAELRDGDGFVGDRASGRAFRALLDDERERIPEGEADPMGDLPSREISKKKLDRLMVEGDPQAAALVLGTIEEFAQEFASVIRRFLRLKEWRDTQRIVVGGGLRASRIGELAIGRAALLLKPEHDIDVRPIRHDPDEAGLIGCVHLAPSWMFSGHDSILAVDIGGSNIRVGIIELNQRKAPDLSKSRVWASELWRHAEDKPDREGAVARMANMLRTPDAAGRQGGAAARAFHRHRLPRPDPRRRLDRKGRAEPARQLGASKIQPAEPAARGLSGDWRA